MDIPAFREKWSKKFPKVMKSEMGVDFLSVIQTQGPLAMVTSVPMGDSEKSVGFAEYVRAYGIFMGIISQCSREGIEIQDEPQDFAPKNATDRPPLKPKK